MADRKIEDYQDIIDLPHHVSGNRPHMAMTGRAAQFSPFAALNGYDAAIKETARLTNRRIELNEEGRQNVSARLSMLQSCLKESPIVEITYFIPDERKAGGRYSTVAGIVKKLDEFHRMVIMADGTRVPIEEIIGVEGDIFWFMDGPIC